jgi:hypothetical protein
MVEDLLGCRSVAAQPAPEPGTSLRAPLHPAQQTGELRTDVRLELKLCDSVS